MLVRSVLVATLLGLISSTTSMPQTTTPRHEQPIIGETMKQVAKQLLAMNISTPDITLDTRTPPRIKQQQQNRKMEKERLENSHAGVAVPVDEDTLLLEESTKKTVYYKQNPTTDSGLSTWILLSGQGSVSSTLKPSRKPIIKLTPEPVRNISVIDVAATNKIMKPVFKKRPATTRTPETTTYIPRSTTKPQAIVKSTTEGVRLRTITTTTTAPKTTPSTSTAPTTMKVTKPPGTKPTSTKPTSAKPTSAKPTGSKSTNARPTDINPINTNPTSINPENPNPTSPNPTNSKPTTMSPITEKSTTKLVKIKASVLSNAMKNKTQTGSVKKQLTTTSATPIAEEEPTEAIETIPSVPTIESNELPLEAKNGEVELNTTAKPKRTTNKKKKVKGKKNKKPSIDRNDTTVTPATKNPSKEKPIGSQIYSYLSREVMPTVGVGIAGLMVAAGLASYFLYPFGGLRRSYEVDRKDKDGSYYYNDYYNGVPEEEMLGKVIAGMPDYSSNYNSYSSRLGNPSLRYRRVDNKYSQPQVSVETVKITPERNSYSQDVRDSYMSQENYKPYYQAQVSNNQEFVVSNSNPDYSNKGYVVNNNQDYVSNNNQDYNSNKNKDYTSKNNQDYMSNNQDYMSNNQDYMNNKQDYMTNKQDYMSNNQDYISNKNNDYISNNNQDYVSNKNQEFVVGNIPKDIVTEAATPAAVPEHGPRALRIRKRRSPSYMDNEIPLDDAPTKLDLFEESTSKQTPYTSSTPVTSTSKTTTMKVSIADEPQPSFFSLLRDLLNFKIRFGLELLQNTTKSFSRYLSRVQAKIDNTTSTSS